MRISTSWLFQRGLAAIDRTEVDLARSQQQLATGKRLLAPADDPAAAARGVDLDRSLALTRQYQRNADQAYDRLAREDSVVASVTNVLQRVRELAVQGNSAALSQADRDSLASELEQRLDELLDLANSRDATGEYLFSGHTSRTQPFAVAPGGAVRYAGDDGVRLVQVSGESRVQITDPGSAVFQRVSNGNGTIAVAAVTANTGSGLIDSGRVVSPGLWDGGSYTIEVTSVAGALQYTVRDGGGATVTSASYEDGAAIGFRGVEVTISGTPEAGDRFTVAASTNQDLFATVQSVIDALAIAGDGASGSSRRANALGRSLTDLDRALDHTAQVRADIGARLATIDSELDANADFELYLEDNLSALRDVDVAEAVTRLTQGSTSLEAAQRSFVAVQNLSLFDYL